MTEKLEAFLTAVSEKPEYADKLQNATKEDMLALAKEMGYDLSEEDLAQPSTELNDDDLDAVAGGKKCSCVIGGGGKQDENDKTCACVGCGWGKREEKGKRCFCWGFGSGKNT